jgi:hypothetical protein
MEPADDFDDDGVPWASPEIQANYEAALGRFIVAFNRLDNLMTVLLEMVLQRTGQPELVKDCAGSNFWLKVLAIDLLKTSTEGKGLKQVPTGSIRLIAKHRNNVAHGHFDQNPFDGDYHIVGKKRLTYSASDVDAQTAEALKAWEALRLAEAFYTFADVVVPP